MDESPRWLGTFGGAQVESRKPHTRDAEKIAQLYPVTHDVIPMTAVSFPRANGALTFYENAVVPGVETISVSYPAEFDATALMSLMQLRLARTVSTSK
jgi:hypothetical protein